MRRQTTESSGTAHGKATEDLRRKTPSFTIGTQTQSETEYNKIHDKACPCKSGQIEQAASAVAHNADGTGKVHITSRQPTASTQLAYFCTLSIPLPPYFFSLSLFDSFLLPYLFNPHQHQSIKTMQKSLEHRGQRALPTSMDSLQTSSVPPTITPILPPSLSMPLQLSANNPSTASHALLLPAPPLLPGAPEDMQVCVRTPRAERVTTSCSECRRRKQKCDQGRPCGNCVKRYPQPLCEYKQNKYVDRGHIVRASNTMKTQISNTSKQTSKSGRPSRTSLQGRPPCARLRLRQVQRHPQPYAATSTATAPTTSTEHISTSSTRRVSYNSELPALSAAPVAASALDHTFCSEPNPFYSRCPRPAAPAPTTVSAAATAATTTMGYVYNSRSGCRKCGTRSRSCTRPLARTRSDGDRRLYRRAGGEYAYADDGHTNAWEKRRRRWHADSV